MFIKRSAILVLALFAATTLFAADAINAPAATTNSVPAKPAVDCPATSGIDGIWETYFLDTGARSAYVCIQTKKNGDIEGRIIKNYPRQGENPTICDKCPGSKKNKPYKNLVILWGFTDNGGGKWVDGHILDAENGDVYTAKAQLQGNELHLRGYVLLPILGKSTVWKKVDKIPEN